MNSNYDNHDIRNERPISKDGRFNYNRSFDIHTLPKINGIPVLGDLSLDSVGIHIAPQPVIDEIIKGCWRQYGVFLDN